MNKTTEALKLAEEALVEYRDNQHIKAPRKTLAAIRAARAQEPMKRDDKQLADWLMRSPQTGEKLRFAGAPEQFGHMSRVRLRDSDGNDWTLTAGLQEGWLTEEQRSANLAVAIAEETEAAIAQADHIADADKMVREPVFKARKAFWKVALGNNTKLANLAKAAIDEVEKYAAPVEPVKQEPVAWALTSENGEVLDCISHTYKVTQPCTVDYDKPLYAAPVRTKDLTDEIDRLCAAIKAEDDYCLDNGDYMLDSNDCIKIIRGEWVRPDYSLDRAVIAADREKNR